MRYIGLLSVSPKLQLTSQLPRELDWTAANQLRATVVTVFYGAIRSAHLGIDDEQLWAVMPMTHDDEQEVGL